MFTKACHGKVADPKCSGKIKHLYTFLVNLTRNSTTDHRMSRDHGLPRRSQSGGGGQRYPESDGGQGRRRDAGSCPPGPFVFRVDKRMRYAASTHPDGTTNQLAHQQCRYMLVFEKLWSHSLNTEIRLRCATNCMLMCLGFSLCFRSCTLSKIDDWRWIWDAICCQSFGTFFIYFASFAEDFEVDTSEDRECFVFGPYK